MRLTAAQERFAQFVADGKSQAEAYRLAYPKFNGKDETCWQMASRLMRKVGARVEELRAALAEKALWTREDSVRTLMKVIDEPDTKRDVVAAVKELNSMHGYDAPKKLEVGGAGGGPLVLRIGGKDLDVADLGW